VVGKSPGGRQQEADATCRFIDAVNPTAHTDPGSTFVETHEPKIFLSCSHDGCDCRVEIHEPCHCDGEGEYRCHCGAPMVAAGG
jgi:hypothetical protein